MIETMPTRVEVWPVAADPWGLWLLSGRSQWSDTEPVPAGSQPWWAMEALLGRHEAADAVVKHMTSARWSREHGQVDTFIAVYAVDRLVRDLWPGAQPISLAVLKAVGKPPVHAADEEPEEITDFHVLAHALRHLALLDYLDEETESHIPEVVKNALKGLRPALAGMYTADNVIDLDAFRSAA